MRNQRFGMIQTEVREWWEANTLYHSNSMVTNTCLLITGAIQIHLPCHPDLCPGEEKRTHITWLMITDWLTVATCSMSTYHFLKLIIHLSLYYYSNTFLYLVNFWRCLFLILHTIVCSLFCCCNDIVFWCHWALHIIPVVSL